MYESLKATSFVATSTPSTSLPFDDVAITFPPSLNSNSNCSLVSSLPTNSLVALMTASAGVTGTSGSGVLVFVTTNPSVTFPEISLTYPFPTGSSLIEYSIFSPALYSSNSVKFPVQLFSLSNTSVLSVFSPFA